VTVFYVVRKMRAAIPIEYIGLHEFGMFVDKKVRKLHNAPDALHVFRGKGAPINVDDGTYC